MKKFMTVLLVTLMVFGLIGFSGVAQLQAAGEIVGITAGAEIFPVYHQISYLAIQYSEKVVAPGINGYSVVDFATAKMKEDYDRRPFSVAPLTAVYTNNSPAKRDDKKSVSGKYVIIELEPTKVCIFEDGWYKPNHNAGLCTWRLVGEQCEWRRIDFSDLKITQKVDVKNAAGKVVVSAGLLPTLNAADVSTPDLDRFKNMSIKSRNGKSNIYFTFYVPKNYDPSKKYPLIFNSTGNGGRLNYKQKDAKGNLVNIGAVVSRDGVALAFSKYEPDSIIVSPQIWRNEPKEWGVDYVDDGLYLIEYIEKNYSIDKSRVYGFSSSFGGMLVSQMMAKNASVFTAYVQCNSTWVLPGLEGGDSFINVYNKDASKNFVGENWYSIQKIMKEARLPKGSYEKGKEAMQDVVKNKVSVWVWHAVNDESIPFLNGYTTYELLRELYAEKGLSAEEISKLVHVTVLDDQEYFSLGIAERHQASKVAVLHREMFDWLFQQVK